MKYVNFLLSLAMPRLWFYAIAEFPNEDVTVKRIMHIVISVFALHFVALFAIHKTFKEEHHYAVFWIGIASTLLFMVVLFLKQNFLFVGTFAVVTFFFYLFYLVVSTDELVKTFKKKKSHDREIHSEYE